MAPTVHLPGADRSIQSYAVRNAPVAARKRDPSAFNRIAYAAAHVVADPLAGHDPWLDPAIDWDRTMAFRHHLWDLGFGVAEAMDTAQRGMGLGWPDARELIGRALREAGSRPGALIACGAGRWPRLPEARTTTPGSTHIFSSRPVSPSFCTGWATCSTPRSRATGARPTTWRQWTSASM